MSSATGKGIDQFIATLDEACAHIPDRPPSSLFRLPVDRVFTMRGFGTVITGTLASGRVRVGETVMIYPSGKTAKVRGVQVHNQSVEEAEAGFRTAINFQGLEKADVQRGEVLSTPKALASSYMVTSSSLAFSGSLLVGGPSSRRRTLGVRNQMRPARRAPTPRKNIIVCTPTVSARGPRTAKPNGPIA